MTTNNTGGTGEKAPDKGGRPPADVDPARVESLAAILCTNEEIGAVLGCSADTLTRRFAENIKKGRERGKASLRRMQFAAARKGNPAMLIWLGKQLLGQKDKVEHTNAPDGLRDMTDDQLNRELATAEREAAAAAAREKPTPSVN